MDYGTSYVRTRRINDYTADIVQPFLIPKKLKMNGADFMTMIIQIDGDGKLIFKGDEKVIEKAGIFDASTIDVSQYRIDAQSLTRLFNDADCRGQEKAQEYVALKDKFIHQQELAQIEFNKPKESHAPAITTPAMKPINAE